MSVTISGDGTITGIPLNKRIEKFTASGTWTVPAGVTYAIAHMIGGGGGAGTSTGAGTAGGASSVGFASGTVSSNGGPAGGLGGAAYAGNLVTPGAANSGRGAITNPVVSVAPGSDAQWVSAGADVTPAASITVTVGSGGATNGGANGGGSGYVYIEYYE